MKLYLYIFVVIIVCANEINGKSKEKNSVEKSKRDKNKKNSEEKIKQNKIKQQWVITVVNDNLVYDTHQGYFNIILFGMNSQKKKYVKSRVINFIGSNFHGGSLIVQKAMTSGLYHLYKIRLLIDNTMGWDLKYINVTNSATRELYYFEYNGWVRNHVGFPKDVQIPYRYIVHEGIIFQSTGQVQRWFLEFHTSDLHSVPFNKTIALLVDGVKIKESKRKITKTFLYSSHVILDFKSQSLHYQKFEVVFEDVGEIFEVYIWNLFEDVWTFDMLEISNETGKKYTFQNNRRIGKDDKYNERLIIVEDKFLFQENNQLKLK